MQAAWERYALLIGLSILLKLEKYLCKVIHLFTQCFVDMQQLCTNLLLSPPKKNDICVYLSK